MRTVVPPLETKSMGFGHLFFQNFLCECFTPKCTSIVIAQISGGKCKKLFFATHGMNCSQMSTEVFTEIQFAVFVEKPQTKSASETSKRNKLNYAFVKQTCCT